MNERERERERCFAFSAAADESVQEQQEPLASKSSESFCNQTNGRRFHLSFSPRFLAHSVTLRRTSHSHCSLRSPRSDDVKLPWKEARSFINMWSTWTKWPPRTKTSGMATMSYFAASEPPAHKSLAFLVSSVVSS